MADIKNVTVVGAGTMGSQIALQTALAGRYQVTLVDAVAGQLERARAQNRKLVDRAVEKGRLTKDRADAALDRITDSGDVESAAAKADLVIEAVIEDFDTKKGVFSALGTAARKDAILASNSSTIDRTPVVLNKEIWGFIVNRILFAASEEAMHLLEGGYASAEDIDIAVQKGLNWPM